MPSIDFSRRAELVEAMDRPDSPEDRLRRTLTQFESLNRIFSRYRSVLMRGVVDDMACNDARSFRVVDLGAGGCDIARWLVRACRTRGLPVAVVAVEHDLRVAGYARSASAGYPEIEVVQADVLDRGLLGGADYVLANHLLHHLSDDLCVELLRRIDCARPRRYLLNDLVRNRWAYFGFLLVAPLLFRRSFVVADGLASIRRGFTMPEVRTLVRTAAVAHPVAIRRLVPSRFVISGGTARGACD
jgi:hypothetical protein